LLKAIKVVHSHTLTTPRSFFPPMGLDLTSFYSPVPTGKCVVFQPSALYVLILQLAARLHVPGSIFASLFLNLGVRFQFQTDWGVFFFSFYPRDLFPFFLSSYLWLTKKFFFPPPPFAFLFSVNFYFFFPRGPKSYLC